MREWRARPREASHGGCRTSRAITLGARARQRLSALPAPRRLPQGEPAQLLIVGLAPGLKGANRTGRPFFGDFAGDLLYPTLLKAGLARGRHHQGTREALQLVDCMITNAVRCVPPQNKPTPKEVAFCRPFLLARMEALPNLTTLLAIGRIAHDAILDALGLKRGAHPFAHGARHALPGGLILLDTYHCSRQNTNTGRLTSAMFEKVVTEAAASLREK